VVVLRDAIAAYPADYTDMIVESLLASSSYHHHHRRARGRVEGS
jgi:hypothetical protein